MSDSPLASGSGGTEQREAKSTSLYGPAGRAALLAGAALVLSHALLGTALEAYAAWAPWMFLAGLMAVGLTVQVSFGLPRPPWTGAAMRAAPGELAIRIALAAAPALFGVIYFTGSGLFHEPARTALPWWTIFLSTALYVGAAPVVEEYYFRHLLHEELIRLFRMTTFAVFANAVWFGAVHAPHIIPVALFSGFCLAMLRTRTGGLAWPILAHCATNLVLQVVQL